METKKALLSKTVWVNLIIAVGAFIPGVDTFIAANPEIITAVFGVINLILRFVTKSAIEIK